MYKSDEKTLNSDFDAMIAKYKEYKKHVVKNIGFNGSSYKTAFGKKISGWNWAKH